MQQNLLAEQEESIKEQRRNSLWYKIGVGVLSIAVISLTLDNK